MKSGAGSGALGSVRNMFDRPIGVVPNSLASSFRVRRAGRGACGFGFLGASFMLAIPSLGEGMNPPRIISAKRTHVQQDSVHVG